MEKTTLSVQELAIQLGISLPKAYELVKQPGFPVLRIGARILIPKDSLMNWLHTQAKGETNP
ncbi:MAG: helix-turn-helix domain-containing protein [Oscillospiraceae bacterium]|nr:helix-turn-helix domain-containing protein [Oscillospiraceae bacterium]